MSTPFRSTVPQPPPWRPWPPEFPVPPSPPPRPQSPAPPPMPTQVWFDSRETADRLLDRRIVVAHGKLDGETVTRLCAQLLTLDAESTEPIRLEVHSLDAELPDALTLMGVLEVIRGPVSVYASGLVRGPALGILAAADHRYAYPNAVLVLSEPQVQFEATADAAASEQAQLESMLGELAGELARVTGRSAEQVREDLRTQRVLTVDEAIEYGLIDERVTRRAGAPPVDPDAR
ncbi:ATP-dependent Clp protease proteolytic subunit [Nocardia cyriacigeorgica]|uniref:ATP-dependent Clp protease proteolytic subunit n=1 Tax=Nocardia cyriacigeorgica TaxID=135487 RepID=A0A5R8NHH9_9NOCA|nr:ATP-dependent Clp protease proteolytic subunit [Nocardia cyriacigeorgica]TLF75128.1 ATP-dependent Clp protease proteolytic subunit [Nocardia cyriacigeorgica]